MPPAKPATRLLSARLLVGDPGAVYEIERALRAADGSPTRAAKALGVSRITLVRWLDLPQLAGAKALVPGPGKYPRGRRLAAQGQ